MKPPRHAELLESSNFRCQLSEKTFETSLIRLGRLEPRVARTRDALIRQRLRDGRLPRDSAAKIYGDPGNGEACAACDFPLRPEQLAMQILAREGRRASREGHIHADCYVVWERERRLLFPAKKSASQEAMFANALIA